MDPRSGRPVQGILTVAVLSRNATSGDALDDALFVLGPRESEGYLRSLRDVDAYFLLPASGRTWSMIRKHGGES
jgi:thiamine biosynthesis lipoprotein ApbE